MVKVGDGNSRRRLPVPGAAAAGRDRDCRPASDVGGLRMSQTKMLRDAHRTSPAGIVIDDVLPPWQRRMIEIRGTAAVVSEGGKAINERFEATLSGSCLCASFPSASTPATRLPAGDRSGRPEQNRRRPACGRCDRSSGSAPRWLASAKRHAVPFQCRIRARVGPLTRGHCAKPTARQSRQPTHHAPRWRRRREARLRPPEWGWLLSATRLPVQCSISMRATGEADGPRAAVASGHGSQVSAACRHRGAHPMPSLAVPVHDERR